MAALRNVHLGRRGCLLADDMGLGKTLQVLTFLAWLIEQGTLSPHGTNANAALWDPILIVMPVILLQNETWLEDMRKFLRGWRHLYTLPGVTRDRTAENAAPPRPLRLATLRWI